jgi:LPS-assembly protein
LKTIRPGIPILLLCLVLALVLAPRTGLAQPVKVTIAGESPWELQADSIKALHDEDVYLAEGNIRFTRGAEYISGDRARFHQESKTAEISGNVVMVSQDFKVTCKRLVANLEHNVGKMYGGTVFFPVNHYYISGDEIERTGPETFKVIQGRATTCDGPNPAWTITGSNIEVQVEGYATAEHTVFSTRYFPVLYTPWIKMPVKSRRQTGLLMPSIQDSSRDGLSFTQPFFWAVSDSKDMTVYLTYRTKRGLETTVEGRYNDWGGRGVYQATYMRDQSPPTIEFKDGPATRESRYWLRGMSDHKTESGFEVKFDVDMVSDPRFLEEFNGGATGFDKSNGQFLAEFGREFAESLDPLRKSTLQVTKSVNNQNWRLAFEFTDDLQDPDNMETIQRLPRIGLDMVRQSIPGTPFYFSSVSEYNNFTRKTDNNSTLKEAGHRLDIHPQVHWPMKFGPFLDLEAALGIRETIYFPYGLEADAEDPDADERNYEFDARELYDFSLAASTNVARIYDVDLGPIKRIKHRIAPEIGFTYVSEQYQGNLPFWDSVDRIDATRSIRYGLTNYLVAKVENKPKFPSPRASMEEEAPTYTYSEFFRLGIFRTYDFLETERILVDRAGLPVEVRRPHGPIDIEAEIYLPPYFWAQAVSRYDTSEDMFIDHNMSLTARDGRGDQLTLGYDLHKEPFLTSGVAEFEEIRANLGVVVNETWSLDFEKRYSLREDRDLETMVAVNYEPQCWGIRLEYRDRPGDRTIAVLVSLLGLGELGGQGGIGGEDETDTAATAASQ